MTELAAWYEESGPMCVHYIQTQADMEEQGFYIYTQGQAFP